MKIEAFGFELRIEFRRVDYERLIIRETNQMIGEMLGAKPIDVKIARIKAVRQLSTKYPRWNVERTVSDMMGLAAAKSFVEQHWGWKQL